MHCLSYRSPTRQSFFADNFKTTEEMFPMPDPIPAIPTLPALDALTKKQNAAKIDQPFTYSNPLSKIHGLKG